MAVVTSAVIAAGASAYGAYSSSQANKAQAQAAQGMYGQAQGNAGAIFGTKPKLVKYNPFFKSDPGYKNLATATIEGSFANRNKAADLTGAINKAITKQAQGRMNSWDPTFMGAMSILERNRNMALNGVLPAGDVMSIAGDRGKLANDLGYAGGSGPQIAADLGLKQLDLQTNVGASLAAQITNILNQVDPIGRHASPENYLLSPQQTVPWAIQESQFAAEFKQQQNLIKAAADPAAAGLFNMQAFNAGFAGQGSRDNAAMANAIAQGIGGIAGAFGGGGYGSVAGAAGNYMASSPAAGATYQAPASWSSPSYQPHSVSATPAGI